jgi:hypothetical protein
MPGVVVRTETQAGPSAALRSPSSQFFIVGITERGDTTKPVLVRGMADAKALLGDRVSYGGVWDQLKVFFDEGGLQAYVSRVVGGAASKGTLTLVDRAGSPLNTIRIDAMNAGAWSSRVKIAVANGSLANTFKISVYLDDILVEEKSNLPTPADAVTAFKDSTYIRAVDLGSATASPNNNPAVLAATALSAGADDRAAVIDADYVTALARFTADLGDGAVAIPGRTATAIWTGIEAHCEANNRLGLLASAVADGKSALLARNAEVKSEFCGIFAPWIVVSDGGSGTRTISPEGYVAACRARAHDQTGPWRIPAGQIAVAQTLVDVATRYSDTDANDLDAGRINVIRYISGSPRLYGWRSLSVDEQAYWFLKDRDLLNYLVVEAGKRLEDYVFQPIDRKGHLLAAVNATLVGLVDPISRAGGLYPMINNAGQQTDPGYKVDTGSSVNTDATLAANEVRARLSVRISPAGGLVSLTIVKVGITSGL